MTTHNTQEQDLRTALEGVVAALDAAQIQECRVDGDRADVISAPPGSNFQNEYRLIARCATGDLWIKQAVAIAKSINFVRSLAAPPRPVDAERVEDAGFGDGRRICEALGFDPANHHNALKCPYCNPDRLTFASPAHSPDKAVTREGDASETIARLEKELGVTGTAAVFREALRLAKQASADARASEPHRALARLTALASIGDHDLRGDMEPDDGEDEVTRLHGIVLDALAPKPTGTEAGRGVVPVGWKLVPEAFTDELRDACKKLGIGPYLGRDMHKAMLAATPTPPVSPLQITRIGDQKQGVEIILKTSEWDSEAHRHEEPYPGMVVTFDPDGSVLDISIEDLSADMAPPVPGVSPSPDSTGPAERVASELEKAWRTGSPTLSLGRVARDNLSVILAALTPSAPIADPSPDSTGQGEAQTQEGGR